MTKILLSKILDITPEELPRWKLRFNKHGAGKSAKDHYLNNDENKDFDTMTLWREKKSMFHKGDILIGLAKLSYDKWLVVKIYEIIDELPKNGNSGVPYITKDHEGSKSFWGRLIINCNCDRTLTYPVHSLSIIEARSEFDVVELRPTKVEDDGFAGYDNVCLSFDKLRTIVKKQPQDWISALKNQQGVYLITDLNTGKHYVGSATSKDSMILSRWSSYINNGHGMNVELKAIIRDNNMGFDYIQKYFQYSILENYNSRVDPSFVKNREKWWKVALDTYFPHGYNRN